MKVALFLTHTWPTSDRRTLVPSTREGVYLGRWSLKLLSLDLRLREALPPWVGTEVTAPPPSIHSPRHTHTGQHFVQKSTLEFPASNIYKHQKGVELRVTKLALGHLLSRLCLDDQLFNALGLQANWAGFHFYKCNTRIHIVFSKSHLLIQN